MSSRLMAALFVVFFFALPVFAQEGNKICYADRVYTLKCGVKEKDKNGKETGKVGGLDCPCVDTEQAGVVNGHCVAALKCHGDVAKDKDGKTTKLKPFDMKEIQDAIKGTSGSEASEDEGPSGGAKSETDKTSGEKTGGNDSGTGDAPKGDQESVLERALRGGSEPEWPKAGTAQNVDQLIRDAEAGAKTPSFMEQIKNTIGDFFRGSGASGGAGPGSSGSAGSGSGDVSGSGGSGSSGTGDDGAGGASGAGAGSTGEGSGLKEWPSGAAEPLTAPPTSAFQTRPDQVDQTYIDESGKLQSYGKPDNTFGAPTEGQKETGVPWWQDLYQEVAAWTEKFFTDPPADVAKEFKAKSEAIEGDASTYNPNKPGWKTGGQALATGGKYDPNAYEAALQTGLAKEYGCGYGAGKTCYALVEYGDKQLVVKVNDNGPLVPGRVIDLNEASMRYLSDGRLGNNSGVLRDVTVTLLEGRDYATGPVTETSSYARGDSPWDSPIQDYVSVEPNPPIPREAPESIRPFVNGTDSYSYGVNNPYADASNYSPWFDASPYPFDPAVASFEPYAPYQPVEYVDNSQEAFENSYTSTQPLNDGSQEAFENAYTNTQPVDDGSQEAFENAYTSTQPIEGLTPEEIQRAEEWQRNERLAQADREYQQYQDEQLAIADALEGRFIDTPPVLPSSQDIFEGAFTTPGGLTNEAHLGIADALENSYTNQHLPSSQDIFEGAFTTAPPVEGLTQEEIRQAEEWQRNERLAQADREYEQYLDEQQAIADNLEGRQIDTPPVLQTSQDEFEGAQTSQKPVEQNNELSGRTRSLGAGEQTRELTDAEIAARIPEPESVDITARKVMGDIRDAIAAEQKWSLDTLSKNISSIGKGISDWLGDTFGTGDKGIAGTDGGLSDGPTLPPEGGAAEPAGSPVPYAKPDLAGPDFTDAAREYDRGQEQAAIARELEGRTQGPLASSQDDFEGNLSTARPLPSSQDAFEGAFTNSQPLESTQDQVEGDQRAGLPSEESLAAERMADERRAEFGMQEDKGPWEKLKDGASKLWSDWFGGGQPDVAGIDGLSDGPTPPPTQAEPTESEKLAAEIRGEREPFYSEERKDMERQRDGAAAALKNMLGPDYEQKIKDGDPLVQPGWKEGANVVAAESARAYMEAQNRLAELDGKPAPFPPKEESASVPPEEKSKWEQQQRDAEARLKQFFGNDYKDVLKDGKDPRIQPGFKEGVWPDAAQTAADYKQAGEKLARIEEQKFKEQMAIANEREGRTEGPKAPPTKVAEGPKTEPPAKEPPAKEPPVEKVPPAKAPPRVSAKWEPKPPARQPPAQRPPTQQPPSQRPPSQQPPGQQQPTGGGTPSPSGGGGFGGGGGGGGLMGLLSQLMESLSKLFGQKKTTPPTQPPVTPPIAPPIIPRGTTTPYLPSIPPPVPPPETPPGTTTATTTPPKKSSAVVMLIANPSTLKAGGKTTLTWAAINAIQCDLFGPTGILLGTGYPETKVTSGVLLTTSNFSVRCTAKNGDIISGVTTVTVK